MEQDVIDMVIDETDVYPEIAEEIYSIAKQFSKDKNQTIDIIVSLVYLIEIVNGM